MHGSIVGESQYGKGSIFHFTIPQRIWPISEQKKVGAEISKVSDEEAEMLPVIGGLNVSEGTKNCGSKKLFLELLGDFYKLIELKSTKLEKCLADGMIKDYTIEVHALKNTARMIGAMELSDLFYQMEQLGNAGRQFDPHIAELMIQLIKADVAYTMHE